MKTTTTLLVLALSSLVFCPQFSLGQTYATLPYYTGFESGSLDASWTAVSTQSGVNIEVIQSGTLTWSSQTAYSYAGNYFLGMDYGTGGTYNLNRADLHLNLSSQTNVVLDFWWAEWNDETEVEDGIFVSDDDGITFTKILDLNGASYTDLTWTHFALNLDSVNSLYGLSFTSTYIVRFQQYDNYYFAGGNDGFLFDEINVTGNVCPATTSSFNMSTCSSYTVPSGDETYTNSGVYTDTIPNAAGCDSIININLTILQPSNSTIFESVCDNYLSPAGNTYTTSGTYTDIIPNSVGCDSTILIDLVINTSTTSTLNETALDSYTAPSGAVYTTSGTYMDTIPNAAGCDSVITINLSINYTGLDEFGDPFVQVYPNPVSGTLHMKGLDKLNNIEQIYVNDMRGRVVAEAAIGMDHFNVSDLEPGVYFLMIRHSRGLSRAQFLKQ